MAQKKPPAVSFDSSMQGEGIPLIARTEVRPSGKQEMAFGLANVAAPERTFFSDAVVIKASSQGYRLSYFQTDFSGTKPRALVEIYLSEEAAKQFSLSLKEMPEGEHEEGFEVDASVEPLNSICYQANFIRMARGAMSACADFYLASPYSLLNGERRGTAYVTPVVRVNMTDAVFAETIRKFFAETRD